MQQLKSAELGLPASTAGEHRVRRSHKTVPAYRVVRQPLGELWRFVDAIYELASFKDARGLTIEDVVAALPSPASR
jgi:hypothetical protein